MIIEAAYVGNNFENLTLLKMSLRDGIRGW